MPGKKTYYPLMSWLVLAYLAINGLLISSYLDTEGHVGGFSLVLFNGVVGVLALSTYLIVRFTSER
jgi:hypothetical protein